jgi:hypothetical protein
MKQLWTEDEAEYHGDYVDFSPSWSWPKPVQKPHPPVILGGAAGPKTVADIAEFCDGWMPISGRHDIAPKFDEIRKAAADRGRDPESIEFGVFGAPNKPDVLDGLAEAGITRAVLGLPPADPATVLGLLDSYADAVSTYNA